MGYNDVKQYVDSLVEYLIQQYKNAVNKVRESLYTDGNVASGVKRGFRLQSAFIY